MSKFVKPKKLNPGDKVAIVSLSWGAPGAFPYRYEVGKQRLESIFALKVMSTKHALKNPRWLYENPQARAEDLMEAFLDPTVKAIISSIGGDDSIRLLPYLDTEIIRNNPKIFLGFSDTTITHFSCLKAGLSSFYGPALMTAFAENVAMHAYSIQGLKKALFSEEVMGEWPQNQEGWTKEILDWETQTNQSITRKLNPPLPWNFLGGSKVVQGHLMGGCVESLQLLNGTPDWLDLNLWEGCILFLEMSEEGISPTALTLFLRNFAAQGILKKAKGILFSKPGGESVSASQFFLYDAAIMKVLEEYELHHLPVVTQMDFGHSDPMWTLPYGTLVEINPTQKSVTFLESGVAG